MTDSVTTGTPTVSAIETTLDSLSLSETDPCHHPPVEDSNESMHDFLIDPNECAEHAQQQAIIRMALNQQTQLLYEQYAREQHPKDPQKQNELVLNMQEQYFTRYMHEHYPSQLFHQEQQLEQLSALRSEKTKEDEKALPELVAWPLIPAKIWTRKELVEFKREILKTQRECCIKIGSLATATVRVPTHPDGASIFWEFATDYYDLGFGLYFEWDLEPPNTISVSISESSDEEELEEEGGSDSSGTQQPPSDRGDSEQTDVERGRRHASDTRPPTDELIPVYRRDCHTEVYCGSHPYPGVGVYVFKFDNSFSLWRSKWLYYRIYYTQ